MGYGKLCAQPLRPLLDQRGEVDFVGGIARVVADIRPARIDGVFKVRTCA